MTNWDLLWKLQQICITFKQQNIMDYEKKYKEALERAKEKRNEYKRLDGEESFVPSDIEYIFPELKESEDERIRKELIKVFSNREKYLIDQSFGDITVSEAIAWLEKQGGQPKKVSIWKHWKDGICGNGEGKLIFLTKNGDDYSLSSSLGFECDYIKLSELDSLMLEKQGEQKPADKVEPKFKIEKEKWYVCTQTYVLRGKIVVIKGQTYQAEKDNVIKGEDGCAFIDRHDGKALDYFRSWTIQDAKDGDVLVTKKGNPFLYDKNRYNNELAYYYVGLDANKELVSKSHHSMLNHFGKLSSISPATKEQRDLLFQKMKEAGYEWDAEKKELKKIEQSELTEFEEAVKDMMDDYRDAIDADAATTEEVKGFAAYMLSLIPHKPAWSEEDEVRIEQICEDLKCGLENFHSSKNVKGLHVDEIIKSNIEWLKSLKERMKG